MYHPTYKLIKAAYSFYNVATTTSLTDLMHDALILARNVIFLLVKFSVKFSIILGTIRCFQCTRFNGKQSFL